MFVSRLRPLNLPEQWQLLGKVVKTVISSGARNLSVIENENKEAFLGARASEISADRCRISPMRNIKLVAALTIAVMLPLIAAAQQTQTPPQSAPSAAAPANYVTLKPLGHNVWAAIAVPGSGAGSNSGFVIGDDGVAVIDSFQKVDAAKSLLAEIRKMTQLPVKYVINTHYHIDHVTGNGVFAEAGATIVAQKNVRDWIHTENKKFYGANITDAQKASVEALTGPTQVYDTVLDLHLGSRVIHVSYELGHTGGDSVVFIPDANVVFCGDLFWRHTLPNLIDASTDAWIATLQVLVDKHPAAAFVSGHGDVGTADDVKAFQGYLIDLRRLVSEGRASGKTGDALVDDLTPKLKEKYGDWGAFNNFVKRNILDTDAEFAGTKKIPQPVGAK
jgi:glyoxylase-like metal-dependent hydrolase (beta-lactamase superfamily II)